MDANAAVSGGGVACVSTMTMHGAVLSHNTATDGGGVYLHQRPQDCGASAFSGLKLSNNTATRGGGGLFSSWQLSVPAASVAAVCVPNCTGCTHHNNAALCVRRWCCGLRLHGCPLTVVDGCYVCLWLGVNMQVRPRCRDTTGEVVLRPHANARCASHHDVHGSNHGCGRVRASRYWVSAVWQCVCLCVCVCVAVCCRVCVAVCVAVWLWLWLCGSVAVWLCGCVAVWTGSSLCSSQPGGRHLTVSHQDSIGPQVQAVHPPQQSQRQHVRHGVFGGAPAVRSHRGRVHAASPAYTAAGWIARNTGVECQRRELPCRLRAVGGWLLPAVP